MQEEYLHYLWRMKRLDFSQLILANGSKQPVYVEEVGWYNLDAGPDFFNGTVVVDGLRWSGNIELHIKSSDWYAHQHHLDEAYNNVVLHVVYEHDKEVYVNGAVLPTIELKEVIDKNHYLNYTSVINNVQKVPCYKTVMEHKLALLQQIDVSFLHRIERKGLGLFDEVEKGTRDKIALLFVALFKAVGGRTNGLPMQELVKLLPYTIISKEIWDPIRLEALLFGCAGLLNEECTDFYYLRLKDQWRFLKGKHQLSEMKRNSWKFGGIRPYSFPSFLIAQLSALLLEFDFINLEKLKSDEIVQRILSLKGNYIHPYWETHFVFGKLSSKRKLKFSTLFKTNILINGIAPYFVALKHIDGNFSHTDKAIEMLEKLPPETNSITNYWKNIGFAPKNALESQGLLELNNEFCNFKKCLSCKVGVEVLEKKI